MRGEQGFFVFLEVTLVTRRQSFERHEQTEKSTGDTAGFAANQFPAIGIFLLRHKTAARRVLVGQDEVGKFLRCENHEVLGKARKMCGHPAESKQIIERKIAVADSIEAVRRDAGKSKLARNRGAINREGIPGERARAHRTGVRACRSVLEAPNVASKRLGVSKQKMRRSEERRVGKECRSRWSPYH